MIGEKDLFFSFLENFDRETLKWAVANFEILRGDLSITDISGNIYELDVSGIGDDPLIYEVNIKTNGKELKYSCGCYSLNNSGHCRHVALSVLYILVRAHACSLAVISKKLFPNGYTLSAGGTGNVTAVMPASGQNQEQPKWSGFNCKPGTVFQHVELYFFGAPTTQMLLNSKVDEYLEEGRHIKFSVVKNKSTSYHPEIKYDGKDGFNYLCDCEAEKGRICVHAKAAFITLSKLKSRDYFLALRDWTKEKNELLAPYGLTVSDEETKNIEFSYDSWGGISIRPPAWLWKKNITDNLNALKSALKEGGKGTGRHAPAPNTIIDFEIGFVFNVTSDKFHTGYELEPVKVFEKKEKQSFKKLSLHVDENLPLLQSLPDDVYEKLVALSDNGMRKFLRDANFHSLFNYGTPWSLMDASQKMEVKKHYLTAVKRLWPFLSDYRYVYMQLEMPFSANKLQPVQIGKSFLKLAFEIEEEGKFYKVMMRFVVNGEQLPIGRGHLYNGALFVLEHAVYLPEHATDLAVMKQFENGFIKIPVSGKQQVVQTVVPSLQKRYALKLPMSLQSRMVDAKPEKQLLLTEQDEKHLVFQPQFRYGGIIVDYQENPENIFVQGVGDEVPGIIVRDAAGEFAFFESIKAMHPKFERQQQQNFFHLPFEETMKKNWFVNAITGLVSNGIQVIGIQNLKTHRYNTNTPVINVKAKNGVDWFDLKVEVSFGDQQVAMTDVRRAILSNQNIVVLGDGTFGLLPEEWLKQYSLLFKMADSQKNGDLRVSKMHYTIIDELHEQIDNEDIMREIAAKKERLKNIGEIDVVAPGADIKGTLRPYQVTGFQWLHTLDEMGWGGCLADDMGLGKTLQVITFLDYLVTKYPGSTHLVICPTSLIYNWESELSKFAPHLRYHIYYGTAREFSDTHFNDYDVIISSYGIVRNDLKTLMQYNWHYIVLDESQAIKNPEAQINKALQVLNARNRVILSGTPLQNNTFDLFAQFNFINPGLLGSREFFRSQFANPIDKNNDTEKSKELRKLIFPFLLRRTKEQVAPDLPDKTETILWCQMGKEQRAVYEEYKNFYRDSLLKKIAEVGMEKAGIYVLEGLLRLRQICDSPVLVKNKEVTTTESVKVQELMREIEENTGSHKMLVFSQFVEMLTLLRESLDKENIRYAYLDGSTPAEKRQDAVNAFQGDADTRVFLISLKAGGVGLNLTAADYVYLVDPWWNPAVEQQAIDRTHRIGQVNKIFAYKMICKDTVEDKIIALQDKKKQVANELITEDAGFVKKLNRDDIAFLFS